MYAAKSRQNLHSRAETLRSLAAWLSGLERRFTTAMIAQLMVQLPRIASLDKMVYDNYFC